MASWEKDVRALQALHESCSPAGAAWPGPWAPVPSFDGTLNDWKTTTCASSGAELACDADGRVVKIRVQSAMSLACQAGLPARFSDLTELSVLRMDGVLNGGGGGNNIAFVFSPLLTLGKLTEISFEDDGLVGGVPELCDYAAFATSAFSLKTLRLNRNALTGRPATSLACLTSLEELELSSNALVGPLPESWTGMRQLRTLAMSHNTGLGAFCHLTLVPIQYDRVGVVNADP